MRFSSNSVALLCAALVCHLAGAQQLVVLNRGAGRPINTRLFGLRQPWPAPAVAERGTVLKNMGVKAVHFSGQTDPAAATMAREAGAEVLGEPAAGARTVADHGLDAALLGTYPAESWPTVLAAYGQAFTRRAVKAGGPLWLTDYGLGAGDGSPAGQWLDKARNGAMHGLYTAGMLLGLLETSGSWQAACAGQLGDLARFEGPGGRISPVAQVFAQTAAAVSSANTLHFVPLNGSPLLPVEVLGTAFPPSLQVVALQAKDTLNFVVFNRGPETVQFGVKLDNDYVKLQRTVLSLGPTEDAGWTTLDPLALGELPWRAPLIPQEAGVCCSAGLLVELESPAYSLSFNALGR